MATVLSLHDGLSKDNLPPPRHCSNTMSQAERDNHAHSLSNTWFVLTPGRRYGSRSINKRMGISLKGSSSVRMMQRAAIPSDAACHALSIPSNYPLNNGTRSNPLPISGPGFPITHTSRLPRVIANSGTSSGLASSVGTRMCATSSPCPLCSRSWDRDWCGH